MKVNSKFMGFRGFILTTEQLSLVNMNITTKEHKNIEFRKVFDKLKQDTKIKVLHRQRPYYLYFVSDFDNDIIQCKMVRKTTLKKHDLGETDIDETFIDDYPYVNVFIHMQSQKFLVELNQNVFADYLTPKIILEKIMNTVLFLNDCYVNIQPIIDEKTFWNYINNSKMIYEVEFILKAPNLFDANDNAETFVKAIERKTNAKTVAVKLANEEGKLSITEENTDTYVQFANAGGGEWSIKRKTKEDGKATTIKSSKKFKTIAINETSQEISKGNVNVNIIINSFNDMEHFDNFKIGEE